MQYYGRHSVFATWSSVEVKVVVVDIDQAIDDDEEIRSQGHAGAYFFAYGLGLWNWLCGSTLDLMLVSLYAIDSTILRRANCCRYHWRHSQCT